MPLKRCSSNGKSGWRWGDAGHCYVGGKEAKKKAIKQGIAIEGPAKFSAKAAELDLDKETLAEILQEEEYGLADQMIIMTIIAAKKLKH